MFRSYENGRTTIKKKLEVLWCPLSSLGCGEDNIIEITEDNSGGTAAIGDEASSGKKGECKRVDVEKGGVEVDKDIDLKGEKL